MDYYRFYELEEKAKKYALKAVKEIEHELMNWEKVHAKINQKIINQISIPGVELYQAIWDYGSVDGKNLIIYCDVLPEFYEKMNKEAIQLRNELIEASGGIYMEDCFFQEMRKLYSFSFNFSIITNEKINELLEKYDPASYNRYRLKEVTNIALTWEEKEEKVKQYCLLGKKMAESLEEKISEYFKPIYQLIQDFIKKEMLIILSDDELFKELNDSTTYKANYYLFDEKGILVDLIQQIEK